MGKTHFKCYRNLKDVSVVAICDADKSRFEDTTGTAGNIPGAEQPLDLTGIELYTDFDKMLTDEKLDAVSITLPTFLHADFTIKALKAGVNVLCEKPMAMDLAQCNDMIAAAQKSRKVLQIGHCIRFWPEYAKTKQLIDSGQYGKVLAASLRRISAIPTWSWNNWLVNQSRSGGAIVDLHIHDTDYVQYLFGLPKSVRSQAVIGPSGGFDYVATQYMYEDQKVVIAEGGFVMTPSFTFEMSFNIVLEKATIVFDCTRNPTFKLCHLQGDPFTPQVEPGDGWSLEIAHFIKVVTKQKVPDIITPEQSLNAIKLVLAEKKSAETGKEVPIK